MGRNIFLRNEMTCIGYDGQSNYKWHCNKCYNITFIPGKVDRAYCPDCKEVKKSVWTSILDFVYKNRLK